MDTAHHMTGYYDPDACDIGEFTALTSQTVSAQDVPNADAVEKNIPIYDMTRLRTALENAGSRQLLLSEWARVLMSGAGVIVLKGAYADTTVLDEATEIFETIIADEKRADGGGADHFAASGANDRIWNSLQKLCQHSSDVHFRYFANTSIAAACEAWLGPNYQMTAQVNLVHPGGAAQKAHRDYHLGFQKSDISAQYPVHVHDLSPTLTLQGAVAHCDMPIESGPTKLLPFSQAYRPGYAAWRRDDFRDLFEERYVQLSLTKGDAVFFNPAIFHAAGANTSSDIHRMANLLQVSSAFGRAMENIDRTNMSKMMYRHAQDAHKTGRVSENALRAAIAATAEGYSFPTNLDSDPPIGGLAPETQQAFFLRALEEGMDQPAFDAGLDAIDARKRA